MKINQRFRVRKDIRNWLVYFEDEGVLVMSEISAYIVSLLVKEKTREELIQETKNRFPECNQNEEVDGVINALQQINLLS